MPNGTCGVISLRIKGGREDAVRFMDSLKLAAIVTHVADSRTCCLHPASTTHRRVQTAGAAVRNMGDYRRELEAVHESDRVLSAAFYSQRNDAAGAVGHILLRKVIVFVALEAGIADGLDLRMRLQELCNGESV